MNVYRFYCKRCHLPFRVPKAKELTPEQYRSLIRTYLCTQCRRPVTEQQVEVLHQAGLK